MDDTRYETHVQLPAEHLIGAGVLDPFDREGRIWMDALHQVPRLLFVPCHV